MSRDWSVVECELLVADYFVMLADELRGASFNKSAHRDRLRSLLDSRTDGSIERKHQNVSAVLRDLGLPFVDGYKPLGNYQGRLREAVATHLSGSTSIHPLADEVASEIPDEARALHWADPRRQVKPPEGLVKDASIAPAFAAPIRHGNFDYTARDDQNRRLGELGERFVLELERRSLREQGEPKLAARVLWASREIGDGLGYDVLSFDRAGRERLIEVKTTNMGARFPFIVTRYEVEVSEKLASSYELCRLFRFARDPRFFRLPGALRATCLLEPRQFTAHVG